METVFVSAGIVFMAGALIGGGLSAFGVTLPALASVKRQVLLFLLGAVLLGLGIYPSLTKSGAQGIADNNRNEVQANVVQSDQNIAQNIAQTNTGGPTGGNSQEAAQGNGSTITHVATMGELEHGVNRNAHDFDNKGQYAANEYDCSELCRTNNSCVAMTYVISRHTCWLKGVVPPPTPDSDMISAVKDKS